MLLVLIVFVIVLQALRILYCYHIVGSTLILGLLESLVLTIRSISILDNQCCMGHLTIVCVLEKVSVIRS